MKNQQFLLQSPTDRVNKLDTVIRSRTNNSLSCDEVSALIQSASPRFQHSIVVHTSPQGFCNALVLECSDTCRDKGKIIFGQAAFGSEDEAGCSSGSLHETQEPAAAIITKRDVQGNLAKSAIHIYIPAQLNMERLVSEHGQGEKTAYSL